MLRVEHLLFHAIYKENRDTTEDFVKLKIIETRGLGYKRSYLVREVLKCKCSIGFDVDNYILRMVGGKPTVFLRSPNPWGKITYMTGPYFTLGLLTVRENAEHVIKNLASFVPFYIFTCRPERAHHYVQYSGANKALVNKRSIQNDFQQTCIVARGTHIIPSKSVYFFYGVTHSHFSKEVRNVPGEANLPSTSYFFRNSNGDQGSSADTPEVLDCDFSSWSSVDEIRERNAELEETNRLLNSERKRRQNREQHLREAVQIVEEGTDVMEIILDE